MIARGFSTYDSLNSEVFFACQACNLGSIYRGQPQDDPVKSTLLLDYARHFDSNPIFVYPGVPTVSTYIPERVAKLYREAARCRRLQLYEAAGAIFRKVIDVATKYIYAHDARLAERNPAEALRPRIKALGQLKILEDDIVELADVVALDGNDAAHDIDPYTADEAEALEELTVDLLERLFVKPAKIAAVRAKQIASGQRKPDPVPE